MEIFLTLSVVVGIVALLGAVLVVQAIVRGWVLTWLWLWFVVPVFGLPLLSITQAIGISLIIAFLTYQTDTRSEEEKKKTNLGVVLSTSLVVNLMALLIGYIVKSFM